MRVFCLGLISKEIVFKTGLGPLSHTTKRRHNIIPTAIIFCFLSVILHLDCDFRSSLAPLFSERFDYDDDDDDYNDFNSGSGDYNSNQYDGVERNWRTSANRNVDETKLKRLMFKHESSSVEDDFDGSNNANNANNDNDNDDDDEDSIEQDVDSLQQQKVSAKIAYAHKKLMQTTSNKNQKPMRKPKSKSKPTNGDKKEKSNESNESNYADWRISGKSDESLELDNANKNDWIEPRIRRILDNIKRSEERSQQILLCKGEGELCNMLFKRPNRPAAP